MFCVHFDAPVPINCNVIEKIACLSLRLKMIDTVYKPDTYIIIQRDLEYKSYVNLCKHVRS